MYAETGILFPYFQNFAQEVQLLEDLCSSHNASPSLTSTIAEYDLGGEGDLFKAPEPIMEEPLGSLDPMVAAISMLSCGEEAISSQGFEQSEIDSFQKEQLLSEVFYDCKKDLLEISALDSTFPDMKFPVGSVEEEILLQKSVSSGSLSSMDWLQSSSLRPSFLDFPGIDFGSFCGMRRAYSEGDIKDRTGSLILSLYGTLGNGNSNGNGNCNGNTNLNQSSSSSLERPLIVSNCTSEERKEKLLRYRNKKTKRNFGRKIKYACRKALADSQPRIRGRFAKTEDSDAPKRQ